MEDTDISREDLDFFETHVRRLLQGIEGDIQGLTYMIEFDREDAEVDPAEEFSYEVSVGEFAVTVNREYKMNPEQKHLRKVVFKKYFGPTTSKRINDHKYDVLFSTITATLVYIRTNFGDCDIQFTKRLPEEEEDDFTTESETETESADEAEEQSANEDDDASLASTLVFIPPPKYTPAMPSPPYVADDEFDEDEFYYEDSVCSGYCSTCRVGGNVSSIADEDIEENSVAVDDSSWISFPSIEDEAEEDASDSDDIDQGNEAEVKDNSSISVPEREVSAAENPAEDDLGAISSNTDQQNEEDNPVGVVSSTMRPNIDHDNDDVHGPQEEVNNDDSTAEHVPARISPNIDQDNEEMAEEASEDQDTEEVPERPATSDATSSNGLKRKSNVFKDDENFEGNAKRFA